MICIASDAQCSAVCSGAKTCAIGENLLLVSDLISRCEEMLIYAGALVRPPPLQRRPMSSLHPYAALERSTTPVSSVPKPGRRSVGQLQRVNCAPCLETLLVGLGMALLSFPEGTYAHYRP